MIQLCTARCDHERRDVDVFERRESWHEPDVEGNGPDGDDASQTPVTENPDVMKTIKDTQRDIKELYNEMGYDDLHKVLSEWLNQDSSVDDDDVNSPVKNDPVKKAKNSTSDVSSAFDELFNN